MSFEFRGLNIRKVGVIGSGQIGPDIALHFAKTLHTFQVPVVVVDVAAEALEKGKAKLTKKVNKGVESKAFTPEMGQKMLAGVTFTQDYGQLAGADLVIEAATENLDLKRKIFKQVEELCGETTVLASNSSHLEPEVIFEPLKNKARTLVAHYFFPAERNPMIEIIPGKQTDPKLADTLMGFYEFIGKFPIRVGSRYGYAIDPIFEGLFLASALCVEEGLGTVKEVDAVGSRALGLAVGSFTAMNLTGGNPLSNHGLQVSHEKLNAWYRSPAALQEAVKTGKPWEVAGRGETVSLPPEREEKIARALRGAYFGLAGQIVDSGISNVSDLDMGLEIALDIKAPFGFMNELGVGKALELVEAYAKGHPDFPVPACLKKQAASKQPFAVQPVLRSDSGDVALVRIRRPKVLNALSGEVYNQLLAVFEGIRRDDRIKAVVLTGFGNKAFVSGADINFLAKIDSAAMAVATTEESKRAGTLIENLGKPVVCALNGLALGGGLELAMCCRAILCAKGLGVAAGLPEVNLGIIPGSGGTQRLPRWIGLEKAAGMLRTGKPISAAKGVELGLFHQEVEWSRLLEAATALARDLAAGKTEVKVISPEPLLAPEKLPDVELGHLSQAIDKILCRAILEGCRKPLPQGLRVESEMFGECYKTADMKIGLDNFIKNGPKAKAQFKHA